MTDENNKKPKLTLKLPQGALNRDLVGEYISLENKNTSSSAKGVLVEMRGNPNIAQKLNIKDEEKLTQQEKVRRVGALHKSWKIEQEVKIEDEQELEENILITEVDDSVTSNLDVDLTKGDNNVSLSNPVVEDVIVNDSNMSDKQETEIISDSKTKFAVDDLKSNDDKHVSDVKAKIDDEKPKKKFSSSDSGLFKRKSKSKFNKFNDYLAVDPLVALVGEAEGVDIPVRVRSPYKRNKHSRKHYSHKVNVNVVIDEKSISLRKLSEKLSLSQDKLIRFLSSDEGKKLEYDDIVSRDLIELLGVEFGYNITFKDKVVYEDLVDSEEQLQERPPVVTIMGHVDHGKTTLLDKIRSTRVADGESGGITQHIGAYQIVSKNGKKITFIDTPGHEAFTAMRMRGAMVTDIVILVVAADDGVNAQTVEAINHTLAAGVSHGVTMIVAVNKIDKHDADVSKALASLLQHNVIVEDLGGDILHVPISAKNGTNIDKLEDAILLQAEMLDLKANFNRAAQGVILEVSIDRRRGLLVTLIVQKGTLNMGDIIVCGNNHTRIRSMEDSEGKQIKSATPSTPVVIMGFSSPPESGESFIVVDNEKLAKSIISDRADSEYRQPVALCDAVNIFEDDNKKYLNLIIKADVNGSLEAILDSVIKLSNDQIKIKIIHKGIGAVTQSDFLLAEASSAMIFAFRVKSDVEQNNKIKIFNYSVIYDLINSIKDSMSSMMKPIISEEVVGVAEVKKIFDIDKLGKVAGCYIKKGKIKIGNPVKLIRDSKLIYETSLEIIRHYKNVVKEVKVGMECGLFLNNYSDIRAGDIIESVEKTESRVRL